MGTLPFRQEPSLAKLRRTYRDRVTARPDLAGTLTPGDVLSCWLLGTCKIGADVRLEVLYETHCPVHPRGHGGFDERVGTGRARRAASARAAGAGSVAGRRRQGCARPARKPAQPGDGHQVETRLLVRHAEERHERTGLLRPLGLSFTAAVLG